MNINEVNELDAMLDSAKKLTEEAKDAFYKWEMEHDIILSDDDRIIWMQGYMCAKRSMSGAVITVKLEGE